MTETHPSPTGAGRLTAVPDHEHASPRRAEQDLDGQAPAHRARSAPDTVLGLPLPGAPLGQDAEREGLAARLSDLSDLAGLHEHTGRLASARGTAAVLHTVLEAGAALLGARRGLLVLRGRHGDAAGLGLDRPERGALETVPRDTGPYAGLLAREDRPALVLHTDLARSPGTDPRYRAVAAQLGIGASCALPLATPEDGPVGAAVWFYDGPAEPSRRQRHLARLYCAFAAPLVAGELERERLRRDCDALRRGLLPDLLPRVPGVRLAVRHAAAGLDRSAGSDWYDALALPEGMLALSVGSVCGGGTGAAAAMGRLRTALRAYAVLEGEDPVAVLGDLEVLLRTTEPARSATALYAWVDPAERQVALAGAGSCPPLLVGGRGADFVETSLSAPLGMLGCWEAPAVELRADPGDVLVLYTEGAARRCGPGLDAGQARLRAAAADAPPEVRQDPERLCAHLEAVCLAGGGAAGTTDDLVLLAARLG
ncbi:serine/threonine-protein phosphatase [Streptacidiphilus sp. ASG 303]|uniref:PP2C family protein-serine/threonine phosphatase n=1 Tax=Streptacidiphilus sp. ASG 303 TaxID=2896847 RepID=UPI001E523F38|nr:PP2C family protein-serine/threonine phosphatase [Streptacidiphilus sp. ASG 303]MCD0482312.1 serine/threonine-protein phosphatase [Streptacidiphilus sp. ASG 303]